MLLFSYVAVCLTSQSYCKKSDLTVFKKVVSHLAELFSKQELKMTETSIFKKNPDKAEKQCKQYPFI